MRRNNRYIYIGSQAPDQSMDKQPSGTQVIDSLLEGGYERDTITTIYGPGGSGKTLLCILAAVKCIEEGKKAIYVDTEGGFSTERLKQIAGKPHNILKNTFFLRPTSFAAQKKAFEKLNDLDDSIGLIVIDTVAMLYRLEIGKSNRVYDVNRELGRQILILNKIARTKNIPVLLTNQVYSKMGEDDVVMVGGDLLKYQSKCIIELKKFQGNRRAALLKKHRSLAEDKLAHFRIIQEGIEPVSQE